MHMIQISMDEEMAEIIVSALLTLAESLKEDFDDDEYQEDIDYTIHRAEEAAMQINKTLQKDEVSH